MPNQMTDEENIHSNLRTNDPRVRWKNDTPVRERQQQHGSSSNSTADRAIAETPQNKATPSKKMRSAKKKMQEDAVAAYHFAGVPNTPWSKKKKKKRQHESSHRHDGHPKQDSQQQSEQRQQNDSIGEREINHDTHENTFNLGGTASLASIYGDLNSSILSVASGASNGDYSNTSGVSTVGSEVSDIMNRTTLSDTHELSTSNFIMSHKVRGIVRERAKSLGMGDEKKNAKGGDDERRGNMGEESMTLPDLTLGDLDDLLAESTADNKKQDREDQTMADTSGEDEMIAFISHQQHTPRKNDVTLDDSTASSLGFNDLLANLDASENKSAMECEEDKVNEDNDNLSSGLGSPVNDNDETSDEVEESFVESTASQNYLDAVLNSGDNQEETETISDAVKGSGGPDDLSGKECIATNNKTAKLTIHHPNDTPPVSQLSNSKLRQSPSFLSGKKKLLPWRKSVGEEELAKIRALTASLRKSNRDKFRGRISLPAAKAQSSVINKGEKGDKPVKGSVRTLFPEVLEAKNVENESAVTLASPKKTESPSKQLEYSTRNSTRFEGDSPEQWPVDAHLKEKKNNIKSSYSQGAQDASLDEDGRSIEFISHQRHSAAKQTESATLDSSSTASSLGLTGLFADLDNTTEKSENTADETGNLSLSFGSPSNSKTEASVATVPLPKKLTSPSKGQFESCHAPAVDSPARNTRSKRKFAFSPANSASKIIDSPARTTRSPSKKSSAMSPSKIIDSPARNTRSAKKIATSPAKSPSKPFPARSLFTPPLSPSAFNQLDSPTEEDASFVAVEVSGHGPFRSRKRNGAPSKEVGKPLKKLASLDTSPSSDPTDTFSLSKEYPFLSIATSSKSPTKTSASTDAKDSGKSVAAHRTEHETNVLMFNALMEDVQGLYKPAVSDDSNVDVSSGVLSFTEDFSIYSVKQVRKKRRETADFSDLMNILDSEEKEAQGDQIEIESATSPSKLHTPRGSSIKTPKSILHSFNKKEGNRSSKKLVMFGSPETAVYNIGSPSSSFTPMQTKISRGKYLSVNDEVEQTTELEGDITQMIAKASDPSLMGPIDESRIEEAEFPSDTSSNDLSSMSPKGTCHFFGGERTEELEKNMCSLVNNNSGEESEFSLPSVSEDSVGTPSNAKTSEPSALIPAEKVPERSSMDIEETAVLEGNLSALVRGKNESNDLPVEETQTITIEGNMASLLNAASKTSSEASENDSLTMEIEGTLASLVDAVSNDSCEAPMGDRDETMQIEGESSSLYRISELNKGYQEISFDQDTESHHASKPKATHQSNWTCSTLTIPLDRNLEALVNGSSQSLAAEHADNHIATQLAEEKVVTATSDATSTMPLDSNLEQLLDNACSVSLQRENGSIQFSKEHVSGEDDTVSELGMNTSQEFSNNSDVQSTLDKIVDDKPLYPLDLELGELLDHGEKDLECGTQDDVILNALDVASTSKLSLIKIETDDVLAQICFDIESQLSTIGVESHFNAILQKRGDTMRMLQHKLRAKDESTSIMMKRFIRAANISIISEWNTWLTEVATLYNDQLHNTALGELEKDLVSIADKTSDINYNREQVALPLLLRSARRATKKNYQRQQVEMIHLDEEVSQVEADLKDAERELERLQMMIGKISAISKSNELSEILSVTVKTNRREADSSFYRFFSVEKLHNWIITASSDSYISIVFKGSTSETNLHMSFWITESSNTAFDSKIGLLPRSVKSLLANHQVRYHPAVSGFLHSKMSLMCQDLNENAQLESSSRISSLIQSVEHKVARINQAAEEFDAILGQCKNSFLQPSDTLKEGFDFHAYITSASHPDARLQVTLTLSDCYPFAPIGINLHSTDTSLDTESMARQLRKRVKPGFGALTSAFKAVHGLFV
ncbi:hypothetical protein ACHAW6_009518 [Cyclotella cf. meneghiniana]